MQDPQPTNPFAHRRQRSRLRSLWWVVIGLAVVALAFAAPRLADQFLLTQLTADLESLPSDEKLDRLQSISQLGLPGIPVLVGAVSKDDRSTARAASDILKRMQDEAMQKSTADGIAVHQRIADELAVRLNAIPEDRYPWLRELLHRTLLDTLNIDTGAARDSYRAATALLARVSLEPESSAQPAPAPPMPGDQEGLMPAEADLLADAGNLQPLRLQPMTEPRQPALQPGPNTLSLNDTGDRPATPEDRWVDPSARPFRAAETMARREPLEPAMIPDDANQDSVIPDEAFALSIGGEPNILSAGSYANNHPLEAYSTRAVIDLLGSIREPLADAARSELVRRGFGTPELQLATRLASTNASVRLGLIDEVPQRSDIDPRQWLLWLAEDGERAIRLRALAALGTMDDPNVTKQLRALLIHEQDPSVAARIRQALVR